MTNTELHQLGEEWRRKAAHIREKYKNTVQAQAASDVALSFETCAEDLERWLQPVESRNELRVESEEGNPT